MVNGLQYALGLINTQGDGDKILTVFSIPKLAVSSAIPSHSGAYNVVLEDHMEPSLTKTLVSTPNDLDGYNPRNQKLRQYPFMYIGFNPPNGTSKIFRYEDFANGTPSFKLISEINPNPTINIIPQNYRGSSGDNLSDMVALNGYPNISYKNDVFNTWLAQNSQIVSLQMNQEEDNYLINQIGNFGQALSGVGSVASEDYGQGISQVSNGLTNAFKNSVNHDYYVKEQMAQVEKQSLLPDQASLSGSNATLLGYNLIDKNIFTRYTIKRQFAERIDKYFDMYGYITNTLKVPNTNNRPNWNYVKTVGANIIGEIPESDLLQIRNLFDNGITLWHNPNTFLDYSQNNR